MQRGRSSFAGYYILLIFARRARGRHSKFTTVRTVLIEASASHRGARTRNGTRAILLSLLGLFPPFRSYGICTKKRKREPRSRLPSVIFFPLRVSKNSSRRTERSTATAVAAMLYEGLSASANTRVWLSFFSVSAFYGGAYVRKYLRSAFREMYGDVLYRGREHELGNNVICEERFSETPLLPRRAAKSNDASLVVLRAYASPFTLFSWWDNFRH